MKIKNAKYLQEKKIEAKRILKSIARHWFKIHKVKKITYASGLYGHAYVKERKIHIPPPTTRKRMYIIAHELGHLACNHISSKKRFIEEYEAERYAHNLMRQFHIKVPRAMTVRAKNYVNNKILQAMARGLSTPIPREINAWTTS